MGKKAIVRSAVALGFGAMAALGSVSVANAQDDRVPPGFDGSYQEFHNACIGPSDVNPNWEPQPWCGSFTQEELNQYGPGQSSGEVQAQQQQQVPTAVPAGGAPSANFDASDRSADTLVLN